MDMTWSPAAHCGLLVDLDGQRLLVDPGYLLGQPIPLIQAESRHFHDNFTGILLHHDATLGIYELFTFNRQGKPFPVSIHARSPESTGFSALLERLLLPENLCAMSV